MQNYAVSMRISKAKGAKSLSIAMGRDLRRGGFYTSCCGNSFVGVGCGVTDL